MFYSDQKENNNNNQKKPQKTKQEQKQQKHYKAKKHFVTFSLFFIVDRQIQHFFFLELCFTLINKVTLHI